MCAKVGMLHKPRLLLDCLGVRAQHPAASDQQDSLQFCYQGCCCLY